MLRISKIDEELATVTKPTLDPAGSLNLQRGDCLVLCAGFEDRALAFLKNAASHSDQFRVVLINYLPLMDENRRTEIHDICRVASVSCFDISYDRQDPSGFGDSFLAALGPVHGRLYVDISGMSRLLIVQIVVSLGIRALGFDRTTILYAEAAEYPPNKEEVQEALTKSDVDPLYSIMLLSSGVFDVMVVPELLSISLDGQQTRLIAFPSFNTDQLTALRTELQPSRYSIIHGAPPAPENKWRTEAIAKLNHIENLKGEESFTADTLDYSETLDRLLEIYRLHGVTERILIAPTGSKMQAVAVGIFRAFIRDVQIVYPTPREFTSPTSYTLGVNKCYQLPLDSFALTDVQ
jgi:hypothetical protein